MQRAGEFFVGTRAGERAGDFVFCSQARPFTRRIVKWHAGGQWTLRFLLLQITLRSSNALFHKAVVRLPCFVFFSHQNLLLNTSLISTHV